MKDCYYYLAIAPIRSRYLDHHKKKPLFSIPVKTNSKECSVDFYSDREKAEILFVKITIPDCKNEKIGEKDADLIQVLKEHALSVLRLTYKDVSFYPIPFWTFHNPKQKKFKMGLSFPEQKNPNFKINAENIRNVFTSTFDDREDKKLLSDSANISIPLQYRYLSLYKIIENNFRNSSGKLNSKSLDAFLSEFGTGLKGKVIGLRDKCAHIRDKKGAMGVTQLNRKQLNEVNEFLPSLQKIIATLLNRKGDGVFKIGLRG